MLVVEDDPQDQATIVSVLSEAGYSTEVVATGAQAIARCAECAFDAVTLDLILPDMSGLDVLKQIRADGRHNDVPVVVLTVIADQAARDSP